jgi:uncharacterized membrane protein YozB (DUF420 family)
MAANLWFWSLALATLGASVACAIHGVRRIRGKDVAGHKRMMTTASLLIGGFLVAYAAKVAVLGHEDKSAWTPFDYTILYVHETGIGALLLGGCVALYRAWRFRGRLGPSLVLPPESDPLAGRAWHRRAGYTALAGGVFALCTAVGVLMRMFMRAAG